MGILSGITDQYEELWKAIIRPPRDKYLVSELGPDFFTLPGNIKVRRDDFDLKNERGLTLKCSRFYPAAQDNNERLPCVVYLHGNCSSRLEALPTITVLLPIRISLIAFDFSGSGHSDGEYVSLGYHEKDDLKTVIKYLRESSHTSRIGLWGRSMGAVTALLYGEEDPSIAGMVLDSPFTDLRVLAEELVGLYISLNIPRFAIAMCLSLIRNSIKIRAQCDINNLSPVMNVDKTFIPAYFVAGKNDSFIRPHHTEELFEKYAGEKNISIVNGDHNSIRPKSLINSISLFFLQALEPNHISTETVQPPLNRPEKSSEFLLPQTLRCSAPSSQQADYFAAQSVAAYYNDNIEQYNDTLPPCLAMTGSIQNNKISDHIFSENIKSPGNDFTRNKTARDESDMLKNSRLNTTINSSKTNFIRSDIFDFSDSKLGTDALTFRFLPRSPKNNANDESSVCDSVDVSDPSSSSSSLFSADDKLSQASLLISSPQTLKSFKTKFSFSNKDNELTNSEGFLFHTEVDLVDSSIHLFYKLLKISLSEDL